MTEDRWTIVVHGGAKTIAQDKAQAHRSGCGEAAAAGAEMLRSGAPALDAVRAAIRVLEDDPTFNAGWGSVPNASGEIEMDAAIMAGTSLAIGAVAALRGIANPIEAAAAVLGAPPILLIGQGARSFARGQGVAPCARRPEVREFGDPGHDTVGCVAIDQNGCIAAATSTGGLAGTIPGRVGDSPLPGCGFYADDAVGAVALSGDGEAIARTLLAAQVMRAMETQPVRDAVGAIFAPLNRLNAEAGVIAINAAGQIGIAHNSDHFALAAASSEFAGVRTALHQNELKLENPNE